MIIFVPMNRILILAGLLLAVACAPERLRDGDLVFQANDPGGFTGAIENVTGGIWSHVGIIQAAPDGLFVLEATPEDGVVRTPLPAFLEASAHDTAGVPLVRYYRLDGPDARKIAAAAVQRAQQWLGRPYDFAFARGMDAVYCSELVHASFLRADGSPVFTARPMTFKGPDGETDPYWTAYYEKLGQPVPEGEPGTNPNDLSRETALREITLKN